jgi:tetratricopeptide (TPR) repeat protein
LKYGSNPFLKESEEEKQDRQILNIHCAYNLVTDYSIEEKFSERKNKKYRANSWNLVFLMYKAQTKVVEAEKLNLLEEQEYQLYLAKENFLEEDYQAALALLEKAKLYILQPEKQQQINLLKGRIYLKQEKGKKAINHFIKLLYSPLQEDTKISLTLNIIPMLLAENWHQEAKIIFEKIEKTQIPTELAQKYFEIKSVLFAEESQ